MAQVTEEHGNLDNINLGVFRSASTVKGGRRFSFGSMVVVGDRRGKIGLGYAKSKEVPPAIEKATKDGKKRMERVTLLENTVPHETVGKSGASIVRLIPASPGTGIVAGATVRAILEMAGVRDCLTKAYGSTNKKNLAKATFHALRQLKSREEIEARRGVVLGASATEEKVRSKNPGAASQPAAPASTEA
jgi:small subunit ribosomal protein S5